MWLLSDTNGNFQYHNYLRCLIRKGVVILWVMCEQPVCYVELSFSLSLLLDVKLAHYPCMNLSHIIHFPVLSIEVSRAIQHFFAAGGLSMSCYVSQHFSASRWTLSLIKYLLSSFCLCQRTHSPHGKLISYLISCYRLLYLV